jgi:phosphate transport system substrate-binding protein
LKVVGIAASTALAAAAPCTATPVQAQGLTGAGSTFAAPIYQKWASMYAEKTGVHVNYQGIGSSGGIKQLSDEIVDFGGTDGPMSDAQLAAAKGGPILHFPTVLGGVSITYNLPDVKQPLKFTGQVIANIYMGKITKWNDPQIASLNRGVTLPNMDIAVAHRTEGSGTTFIFTDYLASVSPEWAKGPGRAQTIDWPVGLGGKGSDGVAGLVKQTPGAIGYIELNYATHNALPSALVQNSAGEWIAPSLASVTSAAAGAVAKLPPNTDYRISIVNSPGKGAYPISSFTWMLVYSHPKDPAKAKELTDFMKWAYETGEGVAGSLDYAPLPAPMISRLIGRLSEVRAATN